MFVAARRNTRGLALLMLLGGIGAAQADAPQVNMPDCSALEDWVGKVDPKKSWRPVQSSRAWLPEAFKAPDFAALFGAPALRWQRSDATAVSKRMYQCGHDAGKAGRRDTRTALYRARRWFKSNLVAVLVAQQRAEAAEKRQAEHSAQQSRADVRKRQIAEAEAQRKRERQSAETQRGAELQQALDAVLSKPDSPRLLETLVVISKISPRSALEVNRAIGRYGTDVGRLLGQARGQGLRMSDPPIGEALQTRIAGLRESIADDYSQRIDALSIAKEPGALRFLERWRAEIKGRLAKGLGKETTAALLKKIDQKHEVLETDILTGMQKRIDTIAESGNATSALKRIAAVASEGSQRGLSPTRQADLHSHAEKVETALAGKAVSEMQAELDSIPESVDGLNTLLNRLRQTRHGPLSRAPAAELEQYRRAAGSRLGDIASAVFPDFKAALGHFPETAQGLRMTRATFVDDEEFKAVPEAERERYQAALEARRKEIRGAMGQTAEAARKKALSAGGDEDLVGHIFRESSSGLAVGFIDEKRAVVGLHGKEDQAPYKATASEVIVYGQGMTLHFRRMGSGAGTVLVWLGKKLYRTDK